MGPSLKQARQLAYRSLILEAAESVFADYGYDAARVQTIAEAAGTSVGTIYGVFGSKAELFHAVLALRLEDVTTGAAAAFSEGGDDLIEQLEKGLDAYVLFLLEHPAFLRIQLHETAWGLGPSRASEAQISGWRFGLDLLAEILARGVEAGLLIPEEPRLMARSLVATQQVYLADWVERGMVESPQEVAARLRTLFRLLFRIERGDRP